MYSYYNLFYYSLFWEAIYLDISGISPPVAAFLFVARICKKILFGMPGHCKGRGVHMDIGYTLSRLCIGYVYDEILAS